MSSPLTPPASGRLGRLVLRALGAAVGVLAGFVALDQGSSLVKERDPLLDALERLHHIALKADQDADRVLVSTAPDLIGVIMCVGDDRAALALGRLGQPALVDQERGLLLRPRHDALGLLLRLLHDPLTLGVDPLGGADLFGHGDTQLIDETESGVLIDHDIRGEGQLLAVCDEGFKALDEEDDVDRCALQADETRGVQADRKYRMPGTRINVRRARWPGRAAPPAGSWPTHRPRSRRSP